MKRNPTILLALIATFALGAGNSYAEKEGQPKGDQRPPPPRKMSLVPERLADKLKLTEDQQTKVNALNAEFEKERDAWLAANKPDKDIQAEMQAAREAKDEAKVNALRAEAREHRKPLAELRQGYMVKVEALLNDDQKATLKETRERMQERRGKPGDKPAGDRKPGDKKPRE